MKNRVAVLLIGAVLALAAPLSRGAERAGRVLIAAGEVTILRDGHRIAAFGGTEVQSGDTVRLGAHSNAQLLLTDNSIIALRSNTTFRIADYHYTGKSAPGEHAFLSLLKGGMRTLTGIIGHVRHEEYHVTTPTATIGIRGTDYGLVQCDNDCRNADGSLAPNGTYGGVTGGRIAVTNKTGEHDFGANQFFTVASESALPKQLIGPPPFLQDTLQGRGHAKGNVAEGSTTQKKEGGEAQGGGGGGSESASTVAPTGQGGGTGDTSVTSTTTSVAPPVVLAETTTSVTNIAAVQGPGAIVQPQQTGTQFYRATGTFSIPVSCSNPPCDTVVTGTFILGVNYDRQTVTFDSAFETNNGEVFNVRSPYGGFPATISNGVVTFSGSSSSVGGGARCSECSPQGTPANFLSISLSGTVSNGTASLTLGGTTPTGSGSFPITLTTWTPPGTAAGAIVTPYYGGGSVAFALSRFALTVDSSGRLTQIGPSLGYLQNHVGSATNAILGSAPSAGNLEWGAWSGGGAQIVDANYVGFTTPSSGPGSWQPWISGTATTALPSSGSVTFTPVGWIVNNGYGTLNYAQLTADFVNLMVGISLNATNTYVGNTFQMNGSSAISPTELRFGNGFSSVTCTGPCNGGATPSGDFGGFFAGPNAKGAGLTFSAGFGGNGVIGAVALAQPGVVPSSLPTSGTVYYRLTGATVPRTCNGAPCGTEYLGDVTLAVNMTTQRAAVKADVRFPTSGANSTSTGYTNAGTPFNLDGIPITVSNGEITFSATTNRSNFPTENGAFRCYNCDSASLESATAGYLQTLTVSGTVTGLQANLTLTASTDLGGTGGFSATLLPATPPNQLAAAMVVPANPAGGPFVALSSAYWGVQAGSSGELVGFGTSVGEPNAQVGGAPNTIVSSNAAAGNLVWGYWGYGGGASIVPYDYNGYTTPTGGPSSYVPWITGDVTPASALSASLGTVAFTPVGWTVNSATTFNSGSLTADFVNRQVSISLDATNTVSGNNFVGTGTSGIGVGSARFGAEFSNVHCTGPCAGTPSGNFAGFFAGPHAEGAGVSFIMGGVGTGNGVDGAVGFKR